MAKVGVTGGAGFIGSNLTKRLLAENYEVVVVDDLSTGLISNIDPQLSEFHKISITDLKGLRKAFNGCQTIFHFAARGSVPRSINNPIATHQINATGTLNILEVARANNAHVIFSSSSSVYGRNVELPKHEKMWLGPMTPYAASKLAAEGYIEAYSYSYGIPTTLFRLFNVFGPRQRPDHEYAAVLPKWIWLAMQGKPIEIYGDGNASRDFTYVDTVLDVAMIAMKERIITDGALNLAYGNRITLLSVIELLKKHFPDLKIIHRQNRYGDVVESQNSPELLIARFPSIQPKDFESSFAETLTWLRDHYQTFANRPMYLD